MLSQPTQNVTPKVYTSWIQCARHLVKQDVWALLFYSGPFYMGQVYSSPQLYCLNVPPKHWHFSFVLPVEIISITNGKWQSWYTNVCDFFVQIILVEFCFTMNWSFSQNILHTTKDNNYKKRSLKDWLHMVVAWKLSMFSTWVIKAAIWVGFLHVRDRSSSKNPFYLLQKEL